MFFFFGEVFPVIFYFSHRRSAWIKKSFTGIFCRLKWRKNLCIKILSDSECRSKASTSWKMILSTSFWSDFLNLITFFVKLSLISCYLIILEVYLRLRRSVLEFIWEQWNAVSPNKVLATSVVFQLYIYIKFILRCENL